MSQEESGASLESAPVEQTESPQLDATSLFGSGPEADDGETVLAEGGATTETPAEGDLTAEELEEIEHEGKKARVPKEFKDAFLRQRDYTQKTQELSENKRAWEAQQATAQQAAQLREATFAESAKVYANQERLQQYRNLNWDAIQQADPNQAMKLDRDMRRLEAETNQLAQGITQKQQHMAFMAQQETAKRIEDGQRQLAREIPGWSPELAGKLLQSAKSLGFNDSELAHVNDPRTVKLLHKAHLYDQLMAKQAVKPPPTPLPKPVTKVGGGNATNTKALSDMSAAEHAAWRESRRNRR
jgi:hypothetical protein